MNLPWRRLRRNRIRSTTVYLPGGTALSFDRELTPAEVMAIISARPRNTTGGARPYVVGADA